MPNCPRCNYPLPHEDAILCPGCGARLESTPSPWDAAKSMIRGYFKSVFEIISQPVRFFRAMPVTGGYSAPLAFALVTHWLGSAIEFLWRALLGGFSGGMIASQLDRLFQMAGEMSPVHSPGRQAGSLIQYKDSVMNWLWGAGSVVLDPFATLFSIFITSALVFVGARILIPTNNAPQGVSFESALRVVCYGLTPSILAGIPFVGSLAAWIGTIIVTVLGAREVYRVGTGRAAVIALFPKILVMSLIFLGIMAFVFLFVGLFSLSQF